MTTFDDFIRINGIHKNEKYGVGQVAGMLSLHKQTIYNYCYLGVKTKKHGIINLATWRNGPQLVIIGSDLIEFLRQINE